MSVLVLGSFQKYLPINSFLHELYRGNTHLRIALAIRKFNFICHFPWQTLCFGNWISKLKTTDLVILFNTSNAKYIIPLLKKKNPKIRIIYWYWDPIDTPSSVPLKQIDNKICEIWSYHKRDCERYGLKFNTQFFVADPVVNKSLLLSDAKIKQSVYFVGEDKERSKTLGDLKLYFDSHHISYKFILTKYKNSKESVVPYSKWIGFSENQENINESKVIIDLVDEIHQSGNTLRTFEAIRKKKKVITNDIGVKDLKFYSSNDFFILGYDPFSKLEEFVNSPFLSIPEKELDYYEICNWLRRFYDFVETNC
jgi:hypothetical protein